MNKLTRINVSTEERFDLLDECHDACVHCQGKIGFYSAQVIEAQPADRTLMRLTKKFCLCNDCADHLVPPRAYWAQITERLKTALYGQRQYA